MATVRLWGQDVGAVAWDANRGLADFEYDPGFLKSGLEISPLMMPARPGICSFPGLPRPTFSGLPGMLADVLPDRFGNRLIDVWLAQQGRSAEDFTPVERLCYMSTRAMGALEFRPALGPQPRTAIPIEISELTRLASEVLKHRTNWAVSLKGETAAALQTIITVGTSAGGNRAKAVIAWNPETHEVRSGQVSTPPGFEPWILKFDGVKDASLGDPQGFGRVEYAYHKMAIEAGLEMSVCRLLEEGGRAHFMTRRFDRDASDGKVHLQSLCAMGHYDFNASGQYGYEQAFSMIQRLNLGHQAMQEMFRRMVFNVVARNQDDHTRNTAFLMDRQGHWRLAPAFDMVWAFNPAGTWTNLHQMTINGKRDRFTREDILSPASQFGIKNASELMERVILAVRQWPKHAKEAGVDPDLAKTVRATHRLGLGLVKK